MVNLNFKSEDFSIKKNSVGLTYVSKVEKIGHENKYKKFSPPKIITIDGERFDYSYIDYMPLGKQYYYSNLIRFKYNHSEGVVDKTVVFW